MIFQKLVQAKIMRRVIKAKIKGEPVGDISTLANLKLWMRLIRY